MRPLEATLLGALLLALAARWIRPRNRQVTGSLLAMLAILAVLHVWFDGMRWEMIPAYSLGVAAAVILGGDLRRMAGQRAGASAHYKALASPLRRAGNGAALLLAAIVAVLLPHLLFPRVSFPRLDGLYDVGRLEVFWTDSTRDEPLTAEVGDKRGLRVSFWYPAESPNGRPLRYHPHPGALAGDIAPRLGLPSLVFRNLVRARTNSTREPRFSIREGRSPLLLFSHGFEGTRVQSTYEFESLASHGYVIASIEHTYAAVGTVLPDGRRAISGGRALIANTVSIVRLIELWAADAKFVLDRLHALPAGDASDTLSGHLQLDRIGYFGHSLGGVTAATVVGRDPRVKAGINMDGVPIGSAVDSGVGRPFLVFTSKAFHPDSISDAELRLIPVDADTARALLAVRDERMSRLLRYGGTEIRLDGARHPSFTDLPLWSPFLARRAGAAGPGDPREVHQAVTTLTLRFFDQYLKGRTRDQNVELPASVSVQFIRHEPRRP